MPPGANCKAPIYLKPLHIRCINWHRLPNSPRFTQVPFGTHKPRNVDRVRMRILLDLATIILYAAGEGASMAASETENLRPARFAMRAGACPGVLRERSING